MTRVCILNPYTLDPNQGGPAGVIRESFARVSGSNWELRHFHEVRGRRAALLKPVVRAFGAWARGFPRSCNLKREIDNSIAAFLGMDGLREYPVVWFPDLVPYFACRPLLQRHQKAVLQLQYPELPAAEAANHGWYNASDLALIEHLQGWALADADAVILANAGAERIYGPLLRPTRRILHLPNAVDRPDPGEPPLLSPDYVNFVFVGRRNAVKGFDLVLDAFAQAYASNTRLRLYLCGNGDPVVQPGVVDLGFSRAPEKWIAAASCVLVPNRSSYMDLNVLQALALNKPLIMSCTEGHAVMRQATPAICEVEAGSVVSLREALQRAPSWLGSLGQNHHYNRDLHETRFSLSAFEQRLGDVCDELLGMAAAA